MWKRKTFWYLWKFVIDWLVWEQLFFWEVQENFTVCIQHQRAPQVAQQLRVCLPVQETRVWSLGQEDPLEKEMTTQSNILAWRIPLGRGAWRGTVHGVTKCWTQLKWLSSSSSSIIPSLLLDISFLFHQLINQINASECFLYSHFSESRYPSYLLFHLLLFPDLLLWNLTNDDKKGVNHQHPGRLGKGT